MIACVFLCNPLKAQDAPAKSHEDLGWELLGEERFGPLKLGMPLSEVLKALGEPTEKTDPVEWGADGRIHQSYTYMALGLSLDIVGEKRERTLNMIEARPPCKFRTSKHVGIGDNMDDVQALYMQYLDPEFSTSDTLVAGSIYGGIIFSGEEGRVAYIFFGAMAE